ncbi:Hypothetical protein CAP_5540 [Chondromyces apiculatus DSM 436]|uniref:Uncharacterized protein n=1 Tax=Chondromyces apiculatus DSM 436 TaxID=1192034 RepID=A0A017T2E4_9BACT|nr:Hypothetical protein CAP_5540 [Chondromyces apiculatus DSM 436]
MRVARQLVTTADLKKMRLSYKTDAQTLAGKYQETSNEGVALYTFAPPYVDLGKPRVKKPVKPRDEDDEGEEDESLYRWPYGPDA